MRIQCAVWIASLGSVLAASRPALACGGGGVTSQRGVFSDSQRIFISVRATGSTEVIAQVGVPETTADYGVLIPVPSEPTLDNQPASQQELDALDGATAPQILLSMSQDDGGGSCGCPGAVGAGSKSSPARGVAVSGPVNVGPVTAVVLDARDGEDVSAWLGENGFVLPDGGSETIAAYSGDGNYFIAIRRNAAAAAGGPTSIGLHYTLAGDHRKLSLGFARLGAAETVAFTLFLAAPRTIGPSPPFSALTIEALDAAVLGRGDYAGAVRAAVAARGSRAFVLESSTPKGALGSAAPSIAALIDDGAVVTRASTILPAAALTEDVIFATPFTAEVPNQRFASTTRVPAIRDASVGLLGLLVLAKALRRRARVES